MRRAHQLSLSHPNLSPNQSKVSQSPRRAGPQATPVRRRLSISSRLPRNRGDAAKTESVDDSQARTRLSFSSSSSHLETIFTFRALRENWASRAGRSPSNRRARYPDWAATAVPALISRDIRASPTSKADCEISAEKRTPIRLCVSPNRAGTGRLAGRFGQTEPAEANGRPRPPAPPGPPGSPHIWKSAKGLDHDIPKWANAARTGAARTDFGDPF